MHKEEWENADVGPLLFFFDEIFKEISLCCNKKLIHLKTEKNKKGEDVTKIEGTAQSGKSRMHFLSFFFFLCLFLEKGKTFLEYINTSGAEIIFIPIWSLHWNPYFLKHFLLSQQPQHQQKDFKKRNVKTNKGMHEANGGRSEEAVLAEWASVRFVEVDRGPNADSILETALNEVAWGEEGEMLGGAARTSEEGGEARVCAGVMGVRKLCYIWFTGVCLTQRGV